MELNRTRRFAIITLMAAVAFLFISVWGIQQRSDAIKQARQADLNRMEAEFRKQESDSLRILAEGRLDMAEIEALMSQMEADTAKQQQYIAQLKSELAERQRLAAMLQAEESARRSQQFQQEKEVAQQTAIQAQEQQRQADLEKNLELQKRMLSTAMTMATRSLQVEERNLKGLLAYQAYLFNRNYQGVQDAPDIYNALYEATAAFNGANFNALSGHDASVNSVAFLPSSNVFYSTGSDGKLLQWDLDGSSRSYRVLIDNNFLNRILTISRDGRWLANSAISQTIQLFNLNQPNSQPAILEGHKSSVEAMEFTPDGRGMYSSGADHTIIYWDLLSLSGTVFTELSGTEVNCLAIAPAGNYLFGGTEDGRIIRWNISTKEQILISSNNGAINSLTINAAGTRLAFGDRNGTLRIYDIRSNSVMQPVSAHSARITDIEFSPDGRQLATASYDKTVKIWDNDNFTNPPIVINKHNAFVMSLDFSPDGRYLVTSSRESGSMLCYWPAHAQQMADQMCSKLERNMSVREWETYVSSDIDFQSTCPNLP